MGIYSKSLMTYIFVCKLLNSFFKESVRHIWKHEYCTFCLKTKSITRYYFNKLLYSLLNNFLTFRKHTAICITRKQYTIDFDIKVSIDFDIKVGVEIFF